MADLLPKERLQPSLLDRLIDANPKGRKIVPARTQNATGAPDTNGGAAEASGAGPEAAQTAGRPQQAGGDRESNFWSASKLRQSVIRDLEWLLNTGNIERSEDLSAYPYAAGSVINYGIPDLVGGSLSGFDRGQLERCVREAIWNFEPRILKKSLKVRIIDKNGTPSRNALSLEIEGEVWSQPVPLHVYLQAEVNVETGKVNFKQAATPGKS